MNSPDALTVKEEPRKAGQLDRVIAKTIDFIIVGALVEIIPVAGYFAGLVYLLISDGVNEGRSLGKWLIGLRVVLRGSPSVQCSLKESILRNFFFGVAYLIFGVLRVIPLIGWILSIAVFGVVVFFEWLIMFGSVDGGRFGDEIAKTMVIEGK
ncbi:MAG: hypothetical protein Q7U10_10940 [Thermodesulfovibrionia bacterium]|nr:hypothetical protein [Thermodesulfovibrionia bacterium]